MGKLINNDKLERLAKALDNRITVSAEELNTIIEEVRNMFGGRALVYLTQLEYESLSDADKHDESKSYFITDAEDLSHEHENKEFLDSLSQTTLDDINNEIDVVEGMLGGKSLVYVTQAEYDALSDDEKLGESILYIITDVENLSHEHENKEFLDSLVEGSLDADTINGYNIWVGTTAELEAITEKDPNTIYLEIENVSPANEVAEVSVFTNNETVVQLEVVNNVINLTNDKYQKVTLVDGVSISLPAVDTFTEVHLYFTTDTDITVSFPECKYRDGEIPSITAGNSYELIAVYNTIEWLANIIIYSSNN